MNCNVYKVDGVKYVESTVSPKIYKEKEIVDDYNHIIDNDYEKNILYLYKGAIVFFKNQKYVHSPTHLKYRIYMKNITETVARNDFDSAVRLEEVDSIPNP